MSSASISNVKYKKKTKSKYPKLSKLKGLLAQYDITMDSLSKQIGRARSTVSLGINGHILFDSMDMLNIRKVINKTSGVNYSTDQIFYDQTA
jgi:hypothetical protein